MRRAAYWLFPLIAAAVAIFIVIFMIQINPSAPHPNDGTDGEDTDTSPQVTEQSGSWLDRFSISEEKGYFYPVNEVSLKLTDGETATVAAHYRLTVPLKSSYELFCVKEELKKSELPYFMRKEGETMTLFVDSNDQNRLVSLVTKLKTYQIKATVSPYTEEK